MATQKTPILDYGRPEKTERARKPLDPWLDSPMSAITGWMFLMVGLWSLRDSEAPAALVAFIGSGALMWNAFFVAPVRLLRLLYAVCLVLTLLGSISTAHCPHAKRYGLGHHVLYASGRPCGNAPRFHTWWGNETGR